MANPLISGLESTLGIDTTAGTSQLQQALQALQSVGVPSIQSLTLPQLQQFVSAGQLSPQQYQAILTNPQVYSQVVQNTQDNSGTNAQKAALQQLAGISQTGSTPIMQAQLYNALQQQNQANKAANSGIMQNAQQRGVGGGGLEFVNQLLSNQGNAQNANSAAVNSAANNAQLALQALTQQGQLGGQLQGQANQMSQAQAEAARQIAEYNSQLQSAANQYNTQNANQAQQMNLANAQNIANQNVQNANARTQYNAQLPQQVFNDQMQKAQGIAGNYGNQANLAQQQAGQNNAFIGNLIGAGATMGGSYLAGQAAKQRAANPGVNQYGTPYDASQSSYYADGGMISGAGMCMDDGGKVPGKAMHPGDTTANDHVPAMLSPGEVVIPRTVAQAPNAPQKAAKFVQKVKAKKMADGGDPGMTPTVNSFAEALQKLEENGLELRLCPKVG